MNTFQHGEDQVRAALEAAQIPPVTIEATMAGYTKGQATQRPLEMQIRRCDQTLGESALAILDLLDQNWGKWKRNEVSGHLRFQDNATLATFNASIQKIQAAGAAQRNAQAELIAKIKPAATP